MGQDRNVYTVDFKDVHQHEEIHKALKEGLNFPNYYGANLDALWDCLTDFIDNDVEIISVPASFQSEKQSAGANDPGPQFVFFISSEYYSFHSSFVWIPIVVAGIRKTCCSLQQDMVPPLSWRYVIIKRICKKKALAGKSEAKEAT